MIALKTGRALRAWRMVLLAACVALLGACAHRNATAPALTGAVDAPGTPYAGFSVGEDAGGAVVLDVFAGPAALAGLLAGDRIESAAARQVDAAHLLEMIHASSPGARLPLQVRRNGRMLEIMLVMGDREQWATPSDYPARNALAASPGRTSSVWLDEVQARTALAAPDLVTENERITQMLRALAHDDRGFNRLQLNRRALAEPATLIELERRLVAQMYPPVQVKNSLVPLLCALLVADCMPGRNSAVAAHSTGLSDFTLAIAAANRRVREAFAATSRAELTADLRYLLEQTARERTLLDRAGALRAVRAMRASMHADFAALLDAFERLLDNASNVPDAPATARPKIPAALAGLVEGEILDYAELDAGYVVIGGRGPNRYRMDRLYAVIDIAGDDRYQWAGGAPLETQTVIDLAGNDRYEARIGGPGAGWLGASVLIDLAGDDAYVSALGGCGAGAFGFGLLFDGAGADIYRCDAWSIGAGIYGGGMLVDAGEGWDTYLSHSLSQGVGGPAGIGLLVDAGGEDLYRANGPVPSTYGTPATYMSFSQGVGFGIRPYDQGGFGALIDYSGNDRYEGGEFSQGGGYFGGAGLLHDAGGNDFYYGNRYAQGFACHQAAGLFSDMAGDDVYWAVRAAAQGAAWDQSVAMMFDGAGNDFYRADSLAQGAAAHQSRAWLFDAGGNDVYWSSVQSAQGAATENTYHFRVDDPVVSLGVLFDGGGQDRYSTGLADGEVRVRHRAGNPDAGRDKSGVAIDE